MQRFAIATFELSCTHICYTKELFPNSFSSLASWHSEDSKPISLPTSTRERVMFGMQAQRRTAEEGVALWTTQGRDVQVGGGRTESICHLAFQLFYSGKN